MKGKIKLFASALLHALLMQNALFCVETTFITDPKSGKKVEVYATPTFYLNGKKLGPMNSFEDFLKPLRSL